MIHDIFFAVIKVPHPIKDNEQIIGELTTLHLNLLGASHINYYDSMQRAIEGFKYSKYKHLVAIEIGIFIRQDANLMDILSLDGRVHPGYKYYGRDDSSIGTVPPRAYFSSRSSVWPSSNMSEIHFIIGKTLDANLVSRYFRDIEYRNLGHSFTNILSQPHYDDSSSDGSKTQELTDDQRWFKASTFGGSIHSPFYGNREMVFSDKSPSILNTDYYVSAGTDYTGPEAIWKPKAIETVHDLNSRDTQEPLYPVGVLNLDRSHNQKLKSWLESNEVYVHDPLYAINNQQTLYPVTPSPETIEEGSWRDWLVSSVPSAQPERQDGFKSMIYSLPTYLRWRKRQIDIGVFYSTLSPLDTIKLLHENRINDSTRVIYLRKTTSVYEITLANSFHTGYGDHFESIERSMDFGGLKINAAVRELLWSNTLEKFGGEEEFKNALNRYQRMDVKVLCIDDLSFDGDSDVYINFGQMFCSIPNVVAIPLEKRNRGFSELMKKVYEHDGIVAEGFDPLGKRVVFRS